MKQPVRNQLSTNQDIRRIPEGRPGHGSEAERGSSVLKARQMWGSKGWLDSLKLS